MNFHILADAIYVAEGGARTRFPYGVKIRTQRGRFVAARYPREACLAIISEEWEAWNRRGDFITVLADRYCPRITDPRGYRNWIANVRREYNKGIIAASVIKVLGKLTTTQ